MISSDTRERKSAVLLWKAITIFQPEKQSPKRFEVFIQALKKRHGELSKFDDDTWLAVIDTMLVRPDGKLMFRFANGADGEK